MVKPTRLHEDDSSHVADPTIVNPVKLDGKRASQVCGRCHSKFHGFKVSREEFAANGLHALDKFPDHGSHSFLDLVRQFGMLLLRH